VHELRDALQRLLFRQAQIVRRYRADGVGVEEVTRHGANGEVFPCCFVSLAEIAFQACSFNHSDISRFIYVIYVGPAAKKTAAVVPFIRATTAPRF
jgi:hypothetical protein